MQMILSRSNLLNILHDSVCFAQLAWCHQITIRNLGSAMRRLFMLRDRWWALCLIAGRFLPGNVHVAMLSLNCLVVDSESMPKPKPKPWPLEKPIANSVPTETVNFSPLKLSHLTNQLPSMYGRPHP